MLRWAGRCRCSSTSWRSGLGSRCQTPPFDACFIDWTTRGSALATCCDRIPTEREKCWIRRQIARLPERSVLLAEDETDLLLFPPLRFGWAPRGSQAKVWLTGCNTQRVLFGAVNLRTGRLALLCLVRQRAPDFCASCASCAAGIAGAISPCCWTEIRVTRRKPRGVWPRKLGVTLLWLPTRSTAPQPGGSSLARRETERQCESPGCEHRRARRTRRPLPAIPSSALRLA